MPEFQFNKRLLSTRPPYSRHFPGESLLDRPHEPRGTIPWHACGGQKVNSFPKNCYHRQTRGPAFSCTLASSHPPSLVLPAPTGGLYFVPLFRATVSCPRAGMCLNPIRVQPPGLEHSQPSGMAWQLAQADDPSPNPGVAGYLLRARLCPGCSQLSSKQRGEVWCAGWLFYSWHQKHFLECHRKQGGAVTTPAQWVSRVPTPPSNQIFSTLHRTQLLEWPQNSPPGPAC